MADISFSPPPAPAPAPAPAAAAAAAGRLDIFGSSASWKLPTTKHRVPPWGLSYTPPNISLAVGGWSEWNRPVEGSSTTTRLRAENPQRKHYYPYDHLGGSHEGGSAVVVGEAVASEPRFHRRMIGSRQAVTYIDDTMARLGKRARQFPPLPRHYETRRAVVETPGKGAREFGIPWNRLSAARGEDGKRPAEKRSKEVSLTQLIPRKGRDYHPLDCLPITTTLPHLSVSLPPPAQATATTTALPPAGLSTNVVLSQDRVAHRSLQHYPLDYVNRQSTLLKDLEYRVLSQERRDGDEAGRRWKKRGGMGVIEACRQKRVAERRALEQAAVAQLPKYPKGETAAGTVATGGTTAAAAPNSKIAGK